MTLLGLLSHLRSLDVQLWLEDDQLRYSAPTGAMTPELRAALRERKPEIIAFLRTVDLPVRTTHYILVDDVTQLAVDIFRPTRNGQLVGEPLPVVWSHDRYHRSSIEGDLVITKLETLPWLQQLLQHGYIIGVVDVRGSGASFGQRHSEFSRLEAQDAYAITEWFAAQPWCDGNIGMFGRSYQGINQYLAASTAPPHLKAIFPEMALFDLYEFVYPGGVFRDTFITNWSQRVHDLDRGGAIAPVTPDRDDPALAEDLTAHRQNRDVLAQSVSLPYRDSWDAAIGSQPYMLLSPSTYVQDVRASGIAIYHLAGWFDAWPRDALLWFNNLDHPQKIIIGPWSHTQSEGLDLAAEHLRWYDYWLKGIDNGVLNEPPIRYWTIGAPEGQEWRTAWQWPLPQAVARPYYFHAGPSTSVDSVNDGILRLEPPESASGHDDYRVDFTTTSGCATRWTNTYSDSFGYPNMAANDRKGLTYTTEPLVTAVEVTGHPVVTLWCRSTASDSHFFVYLEDVDAHGSRYLTEGVLRTACRRTCVAPYNTFGLPYHRCFAEDVAELPNQPVELTIDLLPISVIFHVGHRIRVTITCADRDNAYTPEVVPAPTVTIYRNKIYAACITLPCIDAP